MFYLPVRRLIVLVACVLLVSLSLPLILFPKTAFAKSYSPHSTPIPLSEVVQGTFYSNPNNSGSVDFTAATAGIFSQNFPPAIAFNPSPDQQNCTSSTGIDVNTRPFTDVSPNADGSCTTTIAQGAGQQAGVGNLSSFEAKLVAIINLPSPGQLTTNITADDGWIFCMVNNNFHGPQPTPASGNIMTNPIDSHHCPGLGLPEMADNNSAVFGPTPSTIAINIPSAGSYGIEIDYTECCQGQLTLVVSNNFTPNPITENTSGNWGGYHISIPSSQPSDVVAARGNWSIPQITSCAIPVPGGAQPFTGTMGTWVGLGGVTSGLEQIGTVDDCINGTPKYWAFFEFPPDAPVDINNDPHHPEWQGKYPVFQGDSMHADVTHQGYGQYVVRLFDLTQNWNFTYIKIVSFKDHTPNSAEWIVESTRLHPEDKNGYFPQFYQVNLTACDFSINGGFQPFVNGSNVTRDTLETYDPSTGGIGLPIKATATDPNASTGEDFTVSWQNYGAP